VGLKAMKVYRFTFNAILFFVISIVVLHFSKLSPLISSKR
jgi:hypothetical protein